jgi:hypothetical protein
LSSICATTANSIGVVNSTILACVAYLHLCPFDEDHRTLGGHCLEVAFRQIPREKNAWQVLDVRLHYHHLHDK